jgi:hypothetical protein
VLRFQFKRFLERVGHEIFEWGGLHFRVRSPIVVSPKEWSKSFVQTWRRYPILFVEMRVVC